MAAAGDGETAAAAAAAAHGRGTRSLGWGGEKAGEKSRSSVLRPHPLSSLSLSLLLSLQFSSGLPHPGGENPALASCTISLLLSRTSLGSAPCILVPFFQPVYAPIPGNNQDNLSLKIKGVFGPKI